jgi:lipopolysaccharide/colanic/teichoic acid biosynthesis glycosyltransferase
MTLTAILIAIGLGLVLPELRGWMPPAARFLVGVAVRLLSPSQRERFHEE